MADNPEEQSVIIKIIIYCVGVTAGVAAKLATMHRTKPINLKDILVNTTVAFAASFFVYSVLDYWGYTKMAIMLSVICGRFADDMLKAGFSTVLKIVKITVDENEKPK